MSYKQNDLQGLTLLNKKSNKSIHAKKEKTIQEITLLYKLQWVRQFLAINVILG